MHETSRTLEGATLVIVGFGAIGQEIARKAKAFDMRVITVTRAGRPGPTVDQAVKREQLHEVLPQADAVVLCLPVEPDTIRLFGDAEFARMKRDALFINVGRGDLVDEDALVRALAAKRIGGAALDVTMVEPLPKDSPLWTFENVLISPHSAGCGKDGSERFNAIFAENLRRYQAGEPLLGVVDWEKIADGRWRSVRPRGMDARVPALSRVEDARNRARALRPGRTDHFGSPPDAATTFVHLSISRTMKAENSSGVCGIGSAPSARMRSTTDGSFSSATNAALSRAITAGGVFAGAMMPNQPMDSKPGRPCSANVGTSFSRGNRAVDDIAIALILPLSIAATADGGSTIPSATWPPIRSVTTGAMPRYGTIGSLMPAIWLNISAVRCISVPLPPWPMASFSRFDSAMTSCSDLPAKRRRGRQDERRAATAP